MIHKYSLAIFVLTVVSSCDISDNEIGPDQSFVRIYDNNTFNSAFTPIDVQQTADGGYLILGGTRVEDSDFTGVYLMKVDEGGVFQSEQNLSTDYISPAKSLMNINGTFYFVAMANTSFQASLFPVDDAGEIGTPANLGLSYPMYSTTDGDNIIIQTYNNGNKRTELSVVTTDGTFVNGATFSIGDGDDTEEPIVEHFTRTGRQLPFFAGRMVSGLYYFNGFYNFTISLVFTDLSGDDDEGIVGQLQGQREDGGISGAVHLDSDRFAVSRFNFGDNYILPQVNINVTNGTGLATDLEGNPFPELVPDAPVILKQIEVDQRSVVIYGSNTKGGQIVLLAYSGETGELLGTKYLGFSNPYELASFNETEDEGLVVLGSTSIAGRFDRFCLFKLSKEELQGFTKL